jgi:hypothetical protein
VLQVLIVTSSGALRRRSFIAAVVIFLTTAVVDSILLTTAVVDSTAKRNFRACSYRVATFPMILKLLHAKFMVLELSMPSLIDCLVEVNLSTGVQWEQVNMFCPGAVSL